MSTPVNLNKVRKAREKVAKRATADANAAKFGRTKHQRALEKARAAKARATLDGSKLDDE